MHHVFMGSIEQRVIHAACAYIDSQGYAVPWKTKLDAEEELDKAVKEYEKAYSDASRGVPEKCLLA